MRGFFISEDDASAPVGFAHGLAFHQHGNACGQPVDLFRLRCDHLVQVVGQPFQIRQPLFDFRAHLAPQLIAG